MQIRYYAATRQFDRANNEDFFFADEKDGLYIVADGMGGALGGEVASKFVPLLAGRIIKIFGSVVATGDEDSILHDEKIYCYDYQNALRHTYLETHEELRAAGLKSTDLKLMDMGTTIVVLLFRDDRIYMMNVGDCRCYLLGDGKLRQITRDQSLVQQMVREGKITADEAHVHPKRSKITRWVGGDKFSGMADTYVIPYYVNDRFILCTDGITKMLDDERIEELAKEKDIKDGVDNMLQAIEIRSGKKRDNATAMIVEVAGEVGSAFDKANLEKTVKVKLREIEEEG